MLDYKTNTFLTLCEQMNYRRTAEALRMTQPGVTQHIHALEREYGCALFSYDGRKLALTPQGALLRAYLLRVQYDEKWLRQNLQKNAVPTLRIGATKSIGDYMISDQLLALLNSGEFNVDLLVENTHTLLEYIQKGAIDFAMIEGDFDKTVFGYEKMWAEPFVGICAAEDPLAGKTAALEDILPRHILLREEGSGTRAILELQLAYHSESVRSFRKVNCISSFRVMKDMIAKSGTISFAYQSVIAGDERLAPFWVSGFFAAHELYYVFQKDSHAQQLLRRYLEITQH